MQEQLSQPVPQTECLWCKKEIPIDRQRRYAVTCSSRCRNDRYKAMYYQPKPRLLPNGTVGAISELIVATDLLRKGYEVFRALSPHALCDLAILAEGRLLRVEVKTRYLTKSGSVSQPRLKHPERTDIVARVVGDEIYYQPDLAVAVAKLVEHSPLRLKE